MVRSHRRRLAALGAAIAAASLLLTACSPSGSTGGDSGSGEALDPDNPVQIRVIRSAGGQFEPLMIAIEDGLFAEEGLEVTVEAGTGNPATLAPQLISGQIEFAMIDIASPIAAVSEGVPISLISVIQNHDPDLADSAGILVPPGSSITSVKDLEGKTIATNQLAGLPVVLTNLALEEAGVPLDSVNWVQLTPDALPDAAISGQADAILTFAAFFQGAIQNGFTFLEETGAGAQLPQVTQVAWAASDKYIAENPEIVAAFLRANEKAQQYANENPDRVRDIDREMTQLPEAYIANRDIQPFGGPFHVGVLQKTANALYAQGFTSKELDVAAELLWGDAEQE